MRFLSLVVLWSCEAGTLTIDEPVTPDDPASTDTSAGDTVDGPGSADTTPVDTTDTVSTDDTDAPPPVVSPLGDLREDGPETPVSSDGRFVTSDCTMTFRRFRPTGGSPYPVGVVLTHGFMRSKDQMRGWARHLASWGFDVYTPDLCHATIVDADHAQNGRDLAEFANTHLVGRPVLYLGHSAGGLASVLAATNDPDALAVLGLDLVDSSDEGLRAAPRLTMPVYDLVGDPSWSCNSNGNGVAVANAAPDHAVVRVTDAVHCDFESPTDAGCTTLCSWQFPGPAFNDQQQSRAISAMMTGFVLGMSGVDPRGLDYWTQGTAAWNTLARNGLIEIP